MSKKVGILLILAMLAMVVLAACQTPVATTEAPVATTEAPVATTEAPVATTEAPVVITDTELNVLCTPQEEWCQGMKQEFEAKYGITVNYVRMSAGEALARIEAEKDAPTFDIWWGGPIDSFVSAKGKGLLETYDVAEF